MQYFSQITVYLTNQLNRPDFVEPPCHPPELSNSYKAACASLETVFTNASVIGQCGQNMASLVLCLNAHKLPLKRVVEVFPFPPMIGSNTTETLELVYFQIGNAYFLCES
ncbi:unnamed protein product [Protopolystoma xenopodis]|uniref:Uncharacterized protein n=1 Tax=Protopolystoma xenopodis TaxID=117903 RepID=A0A3S5B4B9_9PLAT|nr:unnamed protein product [Protopolystoma xenopodis]